MSTGPPTLKGPVESACDIRHRRNTTPGNLERTHPPSRFHTRHVRSRHSINPDGRKRRLTAEPTAHERHLPATCSGRFATAGVVGSALPQGCRKRCGPGQTPRPASLGGEVVIQTAGGACSAPASGALPARRRKRVRSSSLRSAGWRTAGPSYGRPGGLPSQVSW